MPIPGGAGCMAAVVHLVLGYPIETLVDCGHLDRDIACWAF